jgi:hypothetical protein
VRYHAAAFFCCGYKLKLSPSRLDRGSNNDPAYLVVLFILHGSTISSLSFAVPFSDVSTLAMITTVPRSVSKRLCRVTGRNPLHKGTVRRKHYDPINDRWSGGYERGARSRGVRGCVSQLSLQGTSEAVRKLSAYRMGKFVML